MTTILDSPAPQTPEEQQIATQLSAVESRLVSRYAGTSGVSEEQVRSVFATAVRRYAHARVRTFLPILVERAARKELESSKT